MNPVGLRFGELNKTAVTFKNKRIKTSGKADAEFPVYTVTGEMKEDTFTAHFKGERGAYTVIVSDNPGYRAYTDTSRDISYLAGDTSLVSEALEKTLRHDAEDLRRIYQVYNGEKRNSLDVTDLRFHDGVIRSSGHHSSVGSYTVEGREKGRPVEFEAVFLTSGRIPQERVTVECLQHDPWFRRLVAGEKKPDFTTRVDRSTIGLNGYEVTQFEEAAAELYRTFKQFKAQ